MADAQEKGKEMRYWTYSEIKNKIRDDLGIQQETFIEPDELLAYVNAGIDEAEAEIHAVYEDYFLTRHEDDLVNGQATYDMPSDIYANKIRAVLYKNGTDVFPIKRFKSGKDMFLELEYQNEISTEDYKYILRNDSASLGVKLHLIPAAKEDVTDGLVLWYLRNANRMEDDTSICDIPEFVQFVIQFAKVRCYEKEGHPNLPAAIQILEHFRGLMVSTLGNMTPDGDDEIEKDMTFYDEMGD